MNKLFNTNKPFSSSIEFTLKLIASIVFLLGSYIVLQFHEPWRDELQAFSLVRNTNSIRDLIHLVRYEGHPLGWYLLQKIIFLFTADFLTIRFVHWAFLSIGILIFIWKSPFPILYRIAIVFGYFFFYEYSAIARNYGIAMPFYMLLCILFNRKNYLLYGLLILITMQFSLYSFIIAFSVAIGYFFYHKDEIIVRYYLGMLLSIVGIILFKYVVNPPDDIGTSPGWNFNPDSYTSAFSVIANALLPIFKFDVHFWNVSILETFLNYNFTQAFQFLISIFLFAWIIKILYQNNLSLLIFLLGISIMLFFMGAKYHGSIRHHGHIYVLLLMVIWIGNFSNPEIQLPFKISSRIKKILLSFPEKYVSKLFIIIIVFQIFGTLQALFFEIKYPFSSSQEAVDYIKNNYPNKPIIACVDAPCTSVSILLNKKIYHANSNAFCEHLIFNNKRGDIGYDTLIVRSERFFNKYPDGILLISKSDSNMKFVSKLPYLKIFETDDAIRYDESYIIYQKSKSIAN